MDIIRFLLGLVLLVAGAEALVRGASRLALALGVSPLIVGLTVVAFGTSSPELAVSMKAVLQAGGADLALGNVLGSNIFNVLAILGLSAFVAPLAVSQQLVRLDVPIMIGVSLLLYVLAANGNVSRVEGGLLFAGLVVYLALLSFLARGTGKAGRNTAPPPVSGGQETGVSERTWVNVLLLAAGLGILLAGSQFLVKGATGIATALGVSQLVIGLTIVAGGTSLPEAATSVIASLRGKPDIAVGNIVGSNIFNILAVSGLSAAVAPSGLAVSPNALHLDLPVMIAVAVVCLPVFFTGHRVSRGEGFLFLLYYLAYLAYIMFSASRHEELPFLRWALLLGVLPLTTLVLAVGVGRDLRRRMGGGGSA